MAEREPVEVTAEIDGQELTAGTLWVHERGGQSATFRYADSYLASPAGYDLDPALPKAAGVFRTPGVVSDAEQEVGPAERPRCRGDQLGPLALFAPHQVLAPAVRGAVSERAKKHQARRRADACG
jgi:hypothetical protein